MCPDRVGVGNNRLQPNEFAVLQLHAVDPATRRRDLAHAATGAQLHAQLFRQPNERARDLPVAPARIPDSFARLPLPHPAAARRPPPGRGAHLFRQAVDRLADALVRRPFPPPPSLRPAQSRFPRARTAGVFDGIPRDRMTDAEHALQEAVANIPSDVRARFETAPKLSDDDRKAVVDVARTALVSFQPKPAPKGTPPPAHAPVAAAAEPGTSGKE